MGAWFDLYHHFAQIMTEGKKENAFRDYSGCETMPDGPEFETCAEPSHCGIECVMGWYLSLRGVKFQIDPSWKHELLRSDGKTRMARSPYHGSWD